VRLGVVWRGEARHGLAGSGVARFGWAWRGMDGHGEARLPSPARVRGRLPAIHDMIAAPVTRFPAPVVFVRTAIRRTDTALDPIPGRRGFLRTDDEAIEFRRHHNHFLELHARRSAGV
jgi:hypothetical protein